ncbi:hypothetical protein MTX26_23910 [Bradyrhizobium sp. ISRA443]|uniref:hypothetical protein n=1 Tax=unclassified Bradyrhizobium TaxID=2631580 RepID=UPI002479F96F|nr:MULTISPECIES: hypothetical protein [unclassified Bradyrhizobium]WGR97448.1 hypothetical protein MTX23_23905 [Bradyrhizobium sp. ISRA436]WGS04336.1 hypothetical protein MTX18_23905 [Bradyrhizobium sp. ISRA437]WGS11220.1 hypothetical protein MTX26_23910 [Bradyrhizobium sp. ISRA443]
MLAARPDQRIAIDEVSREVRAMIAAGDETTQLTRSSELGEADVFQSGWASINDAGLQITAAGLSLWRSLEASRIVQEFSGDRTEQTDATRAEPHQAGARAGAALPSETDLDATGATGEAAAAHATHGSNRPIGAADAGLLNVPAFPGPAFGSIQPANQGGSQLSTLLGFIRTSLPRMGRARRRRPATSFPGQRAEPAGGRMIGPALAFLTLTSLVACIGAAIALGQMSSLKSDIATLRREQAPLRDRLAKLEQIESEKRDADQEAAQDKAEADKAAPDAGTGQSALSLSREESQLVREYIKVAPSAGAAAAAVNVGDPVTGGMIPLPSPLTDKVPRLVGARFATRNGTIIISLRRSHRVDAVLPPN